MSDCGNVQKVFVPTDTKESKAKPAVSGIDITDIAAEKIKHFCNTEKKDPNEHGLYVKVVPDGCSGKSYSMDLAKITDFPDDKVFTHNEANIIIDKMSYIFLIGSTLDYVETLLMSGFQLNNPNIKKSCSCGSSFAV